MPVKVEVLRNLGQWVKVNLGPLPYDIKSNVSNVNTRHFVIENFGGAEYSLMTWRSAKDDLSAKIPHELGPLFDIEVTELERGKPVSIEGILPGNTKSEVLKLTQE
ncbi:MAG: hypothetical protein ABSD69_01585 [Candidatus Levyibacteriota bacterium]|jgi:hypothetical protein